MLRFFRKRIGVEIAILISLVIIISFIAMTAYSYYLSEDSLEASVQSNMQTQAINNSRILSEQLNVYKAIITEVSMNDVVRSMDWDSQKAILENEVEVNGFMKMGVATLDGNITYTNNTSTVISNREYFKAALNDEVYISDPLMSTAENKLVVVFSAPIKDNGGEIIGVLTLTVDGQFVSSLCQTITMGETGYGFILNSEGTTIGHIDEDLVSSEFNAISEVKNDPSLSSLAEIEKIMIQGATGIRTYTKDGSEQYLAYAPISGTTWFLGISASKSELLSAADTLKLNMIVIALSSLAMVCILCVLLINIFVTKPVKAMVVAAEYLGQNNFQYKIPDKFLKRINEVGTLARSFEKIIRNLNNTMEKINIASSQVASGANQISDSSIALSQGATEQSSSIEQLTSSIEEIASQTKINANDSEKANKFVEEAKHSAASGNDKMNNMMKAMEDINTSSKNISKIIGIINDIAFQTNILALNASVEAARAGQYGKGFAVVAEEVRNLAARSASAANDTSNLIKGSIKMVEDGSKIAIDTANELKKILADVSKAAELVNNISLASREQAIALNQINQGIMEVSRVVQTNSAAAEESAAASETLSEQATLLREQIAIFKLKEDNHTSANTGNTVNSDLDDNEPYGYQSVEEEKTE